MDVPLDRTGAVPGTISLHVEVAPAVGTRRGVMFLLAGGPGQGSARVFDLGSDTSVSLFRFLFPGYTLVAYDDRGTGSSGLLDCPPLQTALTADQQRNAATACADTLGPNRSFYSTADHAEDLEAVRQALGFDRIALFGVSYGTKLALAYALAHPDHVDRMVLDSVLPPEQPDPYSADVLRRLPAALDAFCSDGSCREATRTFGADVVAVANRLAARPVAGNVLQADGTTRSERVDGTTFLATVLDADLDPGLAAELPAVVHAARIGNLRPLLRIVSLRNRSSVTTPADLSAALYAATVCRDGPFPWTPDTPAAERPSILQAAVAALPLETFGAFGRWSYRLGNADLCTGWPSPSGGVQLGAGPLPDVPVLAISGGFDLRTPTTNAQAVVARFPQGHLLVVPGVGHSTVTSDPSGCAVRAVRAWIADGTVATCPRRLPFLPPIPSLPPSTTPARSHGALATYAIAVKTVADAKAMWLMASSPTVPGVFGGRLAVATRQFSLVGYSIAPGVTVSGTVRLTSTTLPLRFRGTVTVAGDAAAAGTLELSGPSLRGTLGGRRVGR